MSRTAKRTDVPLTTAQQLASLVKSARDIMRKDRGLSGDLDRLPQLTWIMFLKFLDDMEKVREQEAKLEGKRFRPAVEAPYRWRDWACDECKLTGDDLTSFINSEEARGPDGKKGPGLFKYLRGLAGANGGDRRDVIASVFKDVVNRMVSGYLLRDVVSKVNGIHFDSTEEIHTLGNMYETMLREMRDAAGDSGEFYTPRPVIRFIVEVINPKLGEVVLDPACGTGGFLVEAYKHLEKQCLTVEQRKILQQSSIIGGEAKPLPYLLCQMNLLLHGMEYPHVNYGNSLAVRLSEIGDRDRVDIIMTNPPFGGEEEKGIQGNFPEDRKTSETALLFLQLLMRKLRRSPTPGRAAVVVPDGVLSREDIGSCIREDLLRNFNLSAVVRLPKGVFVPYTPIETNILFFDSTGPTRQTWYYQLPISDGRKIYTKTRPLEYPELLDCKAWIENPSEGTRSWLVRRDAICAPLMSLDIKNPHDVSGVVLHNPDELCRSIRARATGIAEAASIVEGHLGDLRSMVDRVKATMRPIPLALCLSQVDEVVPIDPSIEYRLAGVRLNGKGPFVREVKVGSEIRATTLSRIRKGQFIYSRLFAWRGAFGVVGTDTDGCLVSGEFPMFEVDSRILNVNYLRWFFTQPTVWELVEKKCTGTTKASRNRFKEARLLEMHIPAPKDVVLQQEMAAHLETLRVSVLQAHSEYDPVAASLDALMPSILDRAFKGELI